MVFTFWEGPKPPYISLCLDRMKRMVPDLIIFGPDSEFMTLHHNWKSLGYAHKADCARVAAVCDGKDEANWWIDADTILLSSKFPELKAGVDFQHLRWHDGRVINGYFCGRRGSAIMREWLFKINQFVSAGMKRGWTTLGEQIIGPLADLKYKNVCEEMPLATFIPLNLDRVPNMFTENVDYKAFVKSETVAFALNHGWFKGSEPWLLKASIEEIKSSDTLIGSIFRENN